MTKFVENPPAFPVSTNDGNTRWGMTLRDYFAAAALQGYMSGTLRPADARREGPSNSELAKSSYRLADSMLAGRAKE